MASILRVNTLTDASSNNSTATSTIFNGTAKAWGELDGTGTISLDDNFNIGSVTDNGTGDYRFTYSNAFSTGNNSLQGTANVYHTQSYDSQTTYAELRTYGSSHTSLDASRVNMTVHGDLA